jgi:eukaryotic-like serine/threonine-protein kinase
LASRASGLDLLVGADLGHYRLVEKIGAGGMGEVYRARDEHLARDVAIKVLPPGTLRDESARKNFRKEALVLSRLNHPNIATIHDFDTQQGVDFLVMEYIPGITLSEKVAAGPLPQKEVLRLGVQLAEGLSAAHEHGVVHRDLKPSNLRLTSDGRLKILDFGLAKIWHPLTDSVATKSISETHAMAGTLPYMAPEQVQGKEADARSDIFALGAVLYEMSTGVRPFEGESQIIVANAILEKDPEPISKRQPATLPVLEHVVQTCLAKNPKERYQPARDVRLELKWAAESLTTRGTASKTVVKSPFVWMPWAIAGVTVLLSIVGVIVAPGRKVSQPKYHMVGYREGILQNARFSHDGQTIIYSGQWEGRPPEISIARVGSPESRPLGLASATLAAISPSDELAVIEGCVNVFVLDCKGTLGTVSLAGGAPRQVSANVAFADWSPDSKQLAIVIDDPNDARLESPPGHVLYRRSSGWLGHPRFSPDGKLIAFENHPLGSDDGTIDVVDLEGHQRISKSWWSIEGLAWSPNGKEIWFAGGKSDAGWADAIRAITLSGRDRVVLTMPWVRLLDVSRDSRVLMARQNWRGVLRGLFPGDSEEHPYSWLDETAPNAISSDGKALTFREGGEIYYLANEGQGYYRKTDGSPAVSLGAGAGTISPDGNWIATYSRKKKLAVQPVEPGTPRELSTPDLTTIENLSWSDDNRMIVYEGLTTAGDWNVYKQKVDGGDPILVAHKGRSTLPSMSPDGSVVAIHEDQKGISLYRDGKSQPESLKGALPTETPIRFVNGGHTLLVGHSTVSERDINITLINLNTGYRQVWKHIPYVYSPNYRALVVTSDLKYYAYITSRYSTDLYLVENLH